MNGTPDGLRAIKGYIPWVGRGRYLGEIQDNDRRISVGCVILSCESTERDKFILWIPSPSSGVTCC
jgi:hypothetical protein